MKPSEHEPRVRFDGQNPEPFRIVARGQSRAFFEDFYHSVLRWPWWQFLVFVVCAFLLANSFFALLYWLAPGAIANARPGSFEDAFFFSVQTLATIGYGGMSPVTLFGHAVVTVEAMSGILGVTLITGLAFAKFARPTARVLFSRVAVIHPRNGVPHLVFRMANWRRSTVIEATLRVMLLVEEVTLEGERLRKLVELPMVRDRTPIFRLSWSAMHRIDEASPFHGEAGRAMMAAARTDIVISLSGVDETYGQTVYARHRYSMTDVVPGARFVDVVSEGPRGEWILDYAHFHDTVPVS